MPMQLYFDVHIDKAIHDQLRLRSVDVLRAQDDDATELSDEDLLARSTSLGRLVFTHDTRFKSLALDWRQTVLWLGVRQQTRRHHWRIREGPGIDCQSVRSTGLGEHCPSSTLQMTFDFGIGDLKSARPSRTLLVPLRCTSCSVTFDEPIRTRMGAKVISFGACKPTL